jgi:hypothetical protein
MLFFYFTARDEKQLETIRRENLLWALVVFSKKRYSQLGSNSGVVIHLMAAVRIIISSYYSNSISSIFLFKKKRRKKLEMIVIKVKCIQDRKGLSSVMPSVVEVKVSRHM